MPSKTSELLTRIKNLNTNRSGDRRAPHKPLLVLIAMAKLQQGKSDLEFKELEARLLPLLNAYAPPVKSKHQPELPYWYLQSDGIWEVKEADTLSRQKNGFPKKEALRNSVAGFPADVLDTLQNDTALQGDIIEMLLEEYFPPSVHDDLMAQIGINLEVGVEEAHPSYLPAKKRDPAFRSGVLRAYEHRCAVTGFRAALGANYFGCEAAHVQWHAYGGPDMISNGICLEPTLHKLFDAGAWTLSDEHRILVSQEFTGSTAAIGRLREQHGKHINEPIIGTEKVSREFIRWHREPEFGGVFRTPAMAV